MSDHQDRGGLPIVGILAVLLVLPAAGWLLFSTNAAPSAPPAVHTPTTAPIPLQNTGSTVANDEDTDEETQESDSPE